MTKLNHEQIKRITKKFHSTLETRWKNESNIQLATHQEIEKLINKYNFGTISFDTPKESTLFILQKNNKKEIDFNYPSISYYTNDTGYTEIQTFNDAKILDFLLSEEDFIKQNPATALVNIEPSDALKIQERLNLKNNKAMFQVTKDNFDEMTELLKLYTDLDITDCD